ncbi:hypothetical protein BgiBS90_020992 [Biomphalaria glabrata]|nr:hypothetical protein BgiBS90_020992 [Biomphalaria glabrata]
MVELCLNEKLVIDELPFFFIDGILNRNRRQQSSKRYFATRVNYRHGIQWRVVGIKKSNRDHEIHSASSYSINSLDEQTQAIISVSRRLKSTVISVSSRLK